MLEDGPLKCGDTTPSQPAGGSSPHRPEHRVQHLLDRLKQQYGHDWRYVDHANGRYHATQRCEYWLGHVVENPHEGIARAETEPGQQRPRDDRKDEHREQQVHELDEPERPRHYTAPLTSCFIPRSRASGRQREHSGRRCGTGYASSVPAGRSGSLAEERPADTDHRRSLLDRQLEIV